MKRSTRTILYLCFAVLLAAAMWIVFGAGKMLESGHSGIPITPLAARAQIVSGASDAFHHPVAVFILQLILIIAASGICAFLFRKIGQPSVMGEIVAGIVLGPSLMGAVLPQFSAFIFPAASLGNLQLLSQVGLILFMFVIGMELDANTLKQKAGAAFFISYFSIILPFILGLVLSYFLYSEYAPQGVPFYAFSLFIGIALSIAAFPVLARILKERNLTSTKLGTIALTAAAVGDVAAWCILAFIVAIVKAGAIGSSVYTILAAIVYLCIMLLVVQPLLHRLAALRDNKNVVRRSSMGIIFIVVLLSSYCCEVIGIHALFGAFLAGVIMPHEWNFRKLLMDKIEDVALVLLLPLFFVFMGLRTQVGLLSDMSLWGTCILIVLVAVTGKFGGGTIGARLTGESMKDSLSIGALMNTRGLVELVVLNIGYDLHIITPRMFTMMVLMALVTTFMTNPILNLINRYCRE